MAGRATCPRCDRPCATPGDLIRWRSLAEANSEVCFDTEVFGQLHLLPEEEIADADALRGIIIELRKALWAADCQNARLLEEMNAP